MVIHFNISLCVKLFMYLFTNQKLIPIRSQEKKHQGNIKQMRGISINCRATEGGGRSGHTSQNFSGLMGSQGIRRAERKRGERTKQGSDP